MPTPEGAQPHSDASVVIVTGASAGIGLAIAARRAALGERVVVTGRDAARLDEAAGPIGALAVAVDAGDPEAAELVVAAAMDSYGRVDSIVANAAYIPEPGPLLQASDDDVDRVWHTNVAAPLRLVRAAWNAGMCEHGGAVVMMGSLGGQAFQADMGLYSASKAALHHLTRILAAELGPLVRVNAIAPGLVRTEGSRIGWERAEPMVRERSPLARIGEPDDIADAVDFLLGPQSSWITGQVLVLDGGATVQLARRAKPRKET